MIHKSHLDYFLKNLPDTPLANAYLALIEFELALKQEFLLVKTILRDIEKKLKVSDISQDTIHDLFFQCEDSVGFFKKVSEKIYQESVSLRKQFRDLDTFSLDGKVDSKTESRELEERSKREMLQEKVAEYRHTIGDDFTSTLGEIVRIQKMWEAKLLAELDTPLAKEVMDSLKYIQPGSSEESKILNEIHSRLANRN